MRAQRSYPNESLIQLIASRFFRCLIIREKRSERLRSVVVQAPISGLWLRKDCRYMDLIARCNGTRFGTLASG